MIVATCELKAGRWEFDGEADTMFAVRFAAGRVERLYPKGLEFGYTVKVGTKTVDAGSWPAPNVVVREMSTQRTFEFRPELKADDKVTLKVWASESGRRIEGEFEWKVPRPPSPFPSWTWSGGMWTPPVPYPSDGFYSWDEESGVWVPVEEEVV